MSVRPSHLPPYQVGIAGSAMVVGGAVCLWANLQRTALVLLLGGSALMLFAEYLARRA